MRYYIFAFLVYELLFSAYFYNLYNNNKNEYHKKTIELAKNSFKSVVSSYEMMYDDSYANQADTLSKLVSMANYANTQKRDEIRKKLLNKFMFFFNFKKLNSLNGFHIFDVEGRSLLRFHQPLSYDDYIINKRPSLQKLKKEIIYQKGFEVGVFQESYRFQYPLFYDGKFVGSYEYSVAPAALMNQMSKFYGVYYQLLIKPEFIKNVNSDRISKYYKKLNIGTKVLYVKKRTYRKEISEDRFEYVKHLPELNKVICLGRASVVDYEWHFKNYAVVVLPIKNINNENFACMLVHLNKSEIHNFKKTFMIEMIFVTIFGLMLYMYIRKQIQNREYVRELINLQHDLIVVSDGESIEDANSAFLEFFNYKKLENFRKDHPCICDMFIKEDGFLQERYNESNWIEYMQHHPTENYKVKMLNTAKEERIFSVEIEMIQNSHRFFILFRDITEELYLKEELEERANFDALTQIFNRSRFEFFLSKEIEKSSRYGRSFSLIMFDIDHFKVINDTYGHDIGDVILKELTALVSLHTRDVDIFARWGGEEFMIISQTNIYQSEMFAEKLRQIVSENMFSHVGSVTCSFGVTQYKKGDTLESIVKRCDNMLYSAKESGRNCVASLK